MDLALERQTGVIDKRRGILDSAMDKQIETLQYQIAQLQEQLAQFERLDEAVSSFCSGEKLQSAKAEPANESEKGAEVTYGFL